MKNLYNFRLSILTLLVLVIIVLLLRFCIDINQEVLGFQYFDLVYIAPGLLFTLIVAIVRSHEKLFSTQWWLFVLLSTALYPLIYVSSWLLVWIGVCVIPSIGAMTLLFLMNSFLKHSIANKFILLSLLSGPISGGISIYLVATYDEFTLIMYLPIIFWWIFMAVLIDVAANKTVEHV